ncbi:hypothetical protein TNCV_2273211 [Trichonephila clavipes]|nr:hypothetical protein TNCV_2273211 [Trichonephila clavipes]
MQQKLKEGEKYFLYGFFVDFYSSSLLFLLAIRVFRKSVVYVDSSARILVTLKGHYLMGLMRIKSIETHSLYLKWCGSLESRVTVFLAKFAPIVESGYQHFLIDAVAFPSYSRHARLERDLAGQGSVR